MPAMDTPTASVSISAGILVGQHVAAFQGPIEPYLKNYGVSSTTASKFSGQSFSEVEVYLGIPFAEPPIGQYAFNKSVHLKGKFEQPYNCTKHPAVSLQNPGLIKLMDTAPKGWRETHYAKELLHQPYEASSDCLYLNVFRPVGEHAPSKNIPVSVWIHGGGYQKGSAKEYPGEVIAAMTKRIVVVIQYRCGVLGFFGGNYGLWDQRVALEWVQREIGHFGGDPDNVHIFGESAGASSAAFQLNYDAVMSNGPSKQKQLFRKVTIMSGAENTPWAKKSKQWQQDLAARMAHDSCSKMDGYVNTDTSVAGMQAYFKTMTDEQWAQFYADGRNTTYNPQATMMNMSNCNLSNPSQDGEFVFGDDKVIDYTGYDVTFGTINGDGILMSAFSPMKSYEVGVDYQIISEYFGRFLDEQLDPSKTAIEFYDLGLDHVQTIDWLVEKIGENARVDIVQGRKRLDDRYTINDETRKYAISDDLEKSMNYFTDRFFRLPMLESLSKIKRNGGRVNAYDLAHGINTGFKINVIFDQGPRMAFIKNYYENGINMHGDDINFVFGQYFQPDNKHLVEDIPPSEYETTANIIDLVFNGDDYEVGPGNGSLSASQIKVDGKIHKMYYDRC